MRRRRCGARSFFTAPSRSAVSHPDSPRRGKFLTLNEVAELVAPPKEHRDAVERWLCADGASCRWGVTHDYLFARMTAAAAQRKFGGSRFFVYRCAGADRGGRVPPRHVY